MPRGSESRRYVLTGGRGEDQIGGVRPTSLVHATPNRLRKCPVV